MLSLAFREKLSAEQDVELFNYLEKYFPIKYEFDDDDFDQKISVSVGNEENALQIAREIKMLGFDCNATFRSKFPIFHTDFIAEAKKERPLEYAHILEQRNAQELEFDKEKDKKPLIHGNNHNNNDNEHNYAFSAPDPQPEPENAGNSEEAPPTPTPDRKPLVAQNPIIAPPQNYVTSEQFEQFTKRIEEIAEQNRQILSSSPSTPTTSAPPKKAVKSADFHAKNELIANGIRCERCKIYIRGIDPIGALMMAVREHVMTHFDSDNPLLKRYECRQCQPEFRTNFVDDMENHLKKHGSMVSLPQKRQELVLNLITETHLKVISELCKTCFPEVFEPTPPPISSILAVDTPAKAKASCFPRFDRVFCAKFKIPNSCQGRTSLPMPLIYLS